MPYHIARSSGCPTSKPWAVIKTTTGEVMGCNDSEEAAHRHMAAIMSAEGDHMTMEREVAQVVAFAVKSAVAPLLERIAVLEARAPVQGPAGKDGADGRNGIDGKDGANGLDGKDGANGIAGKDGTNGIDGAPGLNGKDGRAGLDGKDGAPGLNGKDGCDGLNGKDGAAGAQGADGIGLSDGVIDRDGHLILTFSDGRTKDVGAVVGKDGAPGLNGKDGANGSNGKDGAAGLNGKDGEPGLGFDDLNLTFNEVDGVCLDFLRGEQHKTFKLPTPFDAKVWEPSRLYVKGALVTHKRNVWCAQEDTRVQPGLPTPESNRAWRLMIRAGQDGKPGRDGRDLKHEE